MRRFTLLELLIVIAIIGLLVTILMPSLSKAREQAISVVCKSNLSQTGKSISILMDSNNQKLRNDEIYNLPDFWTWSRELYNNNLLEEGSKAFNCPKLYEESKQSGASYFKFNVYGIASEDEGLNFIDLGDYGTDEAVLAADSWNVNSDEGRWELGYGNRNAKSIPIMIHLEKANFLFIDQHVQNPDFVKRK